MSIAITEFRKIIKPKMVELANLHDFDLKINEDGYRFSKKLNSYSYDIYGGFYKEAGNEFIHFYGWNGIFTQYYFANLLKIFENQYPQFNSFCVHPLITFNNFYYCKNWSLSNFKSLKDETTVNVNNEEDVELVFSGFATLYNLVEDINNSTKDLDSIFNLTKNLPIEKLNSILHGAVNESEVPIIMFVYRLLGKDLELDRLKKYLLVTHPYWVTQLSEEYYRALENLNVDKVIQFAEENILDSKFGNSIIKETEIYNNKKSLSYNNRVHGAYLIKQESNDDIVNLINALSSCFNLSFSNDTECFNDLLTKQKNIYIGKFHEFIVIIPNYNDEEVVSIFSWSMQDEICSIIDNFCKEYIFISQYDESILLCMYKFENTSNGVLHIINDNIKYKGIIVKEIKLEAEKQSNNFNKALFILNYYVLKITGFGSLSDKQLLNMKLNRLDSK